MPKRVRRKNVYYGEPVKANLLYSLPQELITLIYSFDDTYTTKFNYVLGELKYHDIDEELYDDFIEDIWNHNSDADDIKISFLGLDAMHFDLEIYCECAYMNYRMKLYLKIKEKLYIEYLEWAYEGGFKEKYVSVKDLCPCCAMPNGRNECELWLGLSAEVRRRFERDYSHIQISRGYSYTDYWDRRMEAEVESIHHTGDMQYDVVIHDELESILSEDNIEDID